MLTKKELDEIESRCEIATPGPWRVGYPWFLCTLDHGRGTYGHDKGDCKYTYRGWKNEDDAWHEIWQDRGLSKTRQKTTPCK